MISTLSFDQFHIFTNIGEELEVDREEWKGRPGRPNDKNGSTDCRNAYWRRCAASSTVNTCEKGFPSESLMIL